MAYWIGYYGTAVFITACLLTALFYIGRSIVSVLRRLLRRQE